MPDMVNVKGLAELQKFLDQLPAKMEANILRSALRDGANVVKDQAAQNIHNVSGDLAKSLKVTTRIDKRRGIVWAKVKAKHFTAPFVEHGTRPHLISVREEDKAINVRRSFKLGRLVRESMTTINRKLRALKIGNTFVGSVDHPGAKPHPFLRPALDARAREAVVAVGNFIKAKLKTKAGLDASHITVEGDE